MEPPKELEVECDYSPTTPGSPHFDLGLEKIVGPKKLFGGETFKEGHQKVQGVEKSVFIDDTKSLALEKSQLGSDLGEKRNELLGEKGISEKCLGLSLGELLSEKGINEKCLGLSLGELLGERRNEMLGEQDIEEKCLGLSLGELLGEKRNQLLGEKGLNEKCLRLLLGELLGEKGINEKCLGSSIGEILGGKGVDEKRLGSSTSELLGEKGVNERRLGLPLGDGADFKGRAIESWKESEEEKQPEIRMTKLSYLESCWNLAHLGILEEIRRALEIVPVDEESGVECGRVLDWLKSMRDSLEKGLREIVESNQVGLEEACNPRVKTLKSPEELVLGEDDGALGGNPDEVLQTVTVGLNDVRKNLNDWIPAMKDEYHSLVVATQAVEPVDLNTLDQGSVEFVPGKLVCVVKAGPNG